MGKRKGEKAEHAEKAAAATPLSAGLADTVNWDKLRESVDYNSRTFGYRGNESQWTVVPESRRQTAPCNRICAIRSEHNVKGEQRGTGWHVESGLILTAAHVVHEAQHVDIRFANSERWIPVPIADIRPDSQFEKDGKTQDCSQFDLARIRISAVEGENFDEPFQLSDDGDLFRTIGFQDDILVEHAGVGRFVGDFVTYEAETGKSHSGCPVFHHGAVCGIHVGLFSGSLPYLAAGESKEPKYLNSAISITA